MCLQNRFLVVPLWCQFWDGDMVRIFLLILRLFVLFRIKLRPSQELHYQVASITFQMFPILSVLRRVGRKVGSRIKCGVCRSPPHVQHVTVPKRQDSGKRPVCITVLLTNTRTQTTTFLFVFLDCGQMAHWNLSRVFVLFLLFALLRASIECVRERKECSLLYRLCCMRLDWDRLVIVDDVVYVGMGSRELSRPKRSYLIWSFLQSN